jgi:hypothetical protein
MRKVNLRMMVTADGVISNVESWMVRDEELDNDFNAELSTFGTALIGYGSYNDMAPYWSKMPDDPFGFEDRCRNGSPVESHAQDDFLADRGRAWMEQLRTGPG